MRFTTAQREAITAHNPRLLVSAAAGSGKTAVLIERILSMLTQGGAGIDRMLIVTFTRAAAGEMRERLETRLTDAARENPALRRQVDILPAAEIDTLHSFCLRLVKEYFQVVDIDPQSGLCSQVQRENLLLEALDEALEACYEAARGGDEALGSLLAKFTDAQVRAMALSLHSFLMSRPGPFKWLAAQTELAPDGEALGNSPAAVALLNDCDMLLRGAQSYHAMAKELAALPDCRGEYAKAIERDGEALGALADAARKGLGALINAMDALSFTRMPSLRLKDSAEISIRDSYKAHRDSYKKLVDSARKLLPASLESAANDIRAMQPALIGLRSLTEAVHANFLEKKRERSLIDFSDLEHMALEILSSPEHAENIRGRYDAMFVDEYQDISALQEAIIAAMTRGDGPGLFMVGDVKQSIYRFRQAEPTLFMNKLAGFSPDSGARDRRIILNRNFRSRENVLEAVNCVFERVMHSEVTEIEYDADARLYPGLPTTGDAAAELRVLSAEGVRSAQRPDAEAREAARVILETVGTQRFTADGSPDGVYAYRDFAVLMPVASGVSDVFEKVFTELKVPVYCERGAGEGGEREISQLMALLRLLDNERDDISLITLLRGPVFGMTDEELSVIRLISPERENGFLDALINAASSGGELSEMCSRVLKALERERFLHSNMPLCDYLWDFLSRSGLYAYYGAQPSGKQRQANLRMLCHRAAEFARQGGGELSQFLSLIEGFGGTREGLSPPVISPWENVVRIMTIHKSKGLEFPVTIITGLGDAIHRRGQTGPLAAHPRLGVGLMYVNEEMRVKRQTLTCAAIALRAKAEEKAERARQLYVGMTRARDKLVLIGHLGKSDFERFMRDADTPGMPAADDRYSAWEASSMLEWICGAVCVHGVADDVSTYGECKSGREYHFSTFSTLFPHKCAHWRVVFHIREQSLGYSAQGHDSQGEAPPAARLGGVVSRARSDARAIARGETPKGIAFSARHGFTHSPFKTGVTALCRQLGESEEEGASQKRVPLEMAYPRLIAEQPAAPGFMLDKGASIGLMRGVATHKALSMLPFTREMITDAGALENELELLVEDGRLTREERSLISMKSLRGFFGSELFMMALRSPQIRREWSFNMLLPEVCEGVVQGVIDLCFIHDGEWVLMDYKTDAVKSAEALWEKYGRQMGIYRAALERITGRFVKGEWLYSLSLCEAARRP